MPLWLTTTTSSSDQVSWETLAIRLGMALLSGLLVSEIYRRTRRQVAENGSFPGTLLLLCVLIAMVTQVIGDNVARAFSLVGALSIVRFRTVVQDTKDTAFVIFAVAVGMAVGAGQPAVALTGTIAVALAAWWFRDVLPPVETASMAVYELDVRLGWSREAEAQLKSVLADHAMRVQPLGGGTARQGSALSLSFQLSMQEQTDLSRLIAELNRIDSVQSIDLKRLPQAGKS
jgi:uncharacterized membrane protein YhiD involved in acid resistance